MTRLTRLAARAAARLIPAGSRVLVATSGGPDSQALLSVLKTFDVQLVAAGIDHGLRSNAHRELDLAEALAGKLEVPFVRRSVQVAAGNVANEARKARYAALNAIADEHGCAFIAVGHTSTDQLETVLLGMLRSDGIGSRLGMPEKRGRIVRPFLEARRFDVLAHLSTHKIPYASDPTNSDTKRSRARLREEVLPVLRALNPRIEQTIGSWVQDRAEDEQLLRAAAARLLRPVTHPHRVGPVVPSLTRAAFANAPLTLRRRALRDWLTAQGLVPRRRLVDKLLQALEHPGMRLKTREGSFVSDEQALWAAHPNDYHLPLAIPGEAMLPDTTTPIVARLIDAPSGGYAAILGGRSPERCVAFDADGLSSEGVVLRSWQPGDRIAPFGQHAGSTKVGDLFTNAKIPGALRLGWPVIAHDATILWVVGLRRGSHAPITATTRKVVIFEALDTRAR